MTLNDTRHPLEKMIDEACQLQPEEVEAIQANTSARKAFDAIVEEIQKHVDEVSHPKFTIRLWELLRDHAIGEVGTPTVKAEVKHIKPMDEKRAKAFLDEEMQRGKHAGRIIRDIVKQVEYLHDFAFNPDFFQQEMQAFVELLKRKPNFIDSLAAEKAEKAAKQETKKSKKKKAEVESAPTTESTT